VAGTPSERITDRPDLSFTRHSGLTFGQNDGSPPHIVLAAHAPGAHGVSVMRFHFHKGLHACGTSLHHMIYLTLAHEKKIACRIDDRRLDHVARRGYGPNSARLAELKRRYDPHNLFRSATALPRLA
jgi:FAD/FMN-containing dehydrogenase